MRSWRYVKGVRRATERHGERIESASRNYAHKLGECVTELAPRYRSIVVLEGLNRLRERAKKDSKFNKKFALWSYYKSIQFCIEYKA